MQSNTNLVVDGTSPTIDMLASAIPSFSGDETSHKKADYLSYRISNFSITEASKLTPVSMKQIKRWRDADPQFAYLDGAGLTELRKKLGNEFLDMQFARNFRLVMEKDFRVLYKDATGEPLTQSELIYIQKIRQHYTPQSLAAIKQILGGGTIDAPFNFTEFTMKIQREQITVTGERTQ